MSATTNWLPFTEPGLPFPMPEPNAIEHAEPGGVTCTTRKLSPAHRSHKGEGSPRSVYEVG
jgi:hypothetical protein